MTGPDENFDIFLKRLKPRELTPKEKANVLALGICCIDGRCTAENARPVSFPGGTPGLYAVALAAMEKLDLQDAPDSEILWDILKESSTDNIWYHGDDHAHDDGCGHLKHLAASPEDYAMSDSGVAAVATVRASLEDQRIDLTGGHEESIVIIVDDAKPMQDQPLFWIQHQTQEGSQAFVYHRTLTRLAISEYAQKIAAKMGTADKGVIQIISEEMLRIADMHVTVTKDRLAPNTPKRTIGSDELARVTTSN